MMITVSSVNTSKTIFLNKKNIEQSKHSFYFQKTAEKDKKDSFELTNKNSNLSFKGKEEKASEALNIMKDKGLLVLVGLTLCFIGLVTYVMTKSPDKDDKE